MRKNNNTCLNKCFQIFLRCSPQIQLDVIVENLDGIFRSILLAVHLRCAANSTKDVTCEGEVEHLLRCYLFKIAIMMSELNEKVA